MSAPYDTAQLFKTDHALFDFIENQYISIYHRLGTRTLVGMSLCVFVIYFLLNARVSSIFATLWLIIALGANFSRIILKPNFNDIKKHIRIITWLHLSRGLVFTLPLLAFLNLRETDRVIITIIAITLCTASVSTTNGYKNIYLWFVTPVLLPLCVAWLYLGMKIQDKSFEYYLLGFLLFIYFLYLIGLGKDLFKVFEESCNLRFLEKDKNEQLKSALELAKNASLAKTRFLASASHDLRQPMHTIGVLLATLSMRHLDERSREIVNVLGTVNSSLASQLDGLLDISKLDAGVVAPDFQIYRLDELVHTHASKIILTEKKKDLYLHVHADKEVRVRTDVVLFDRILMNLIGNAIKFTEQGGIDITLSTTNEKAILEVADSGIGISDGFQSLVFQEFYQVGNPERDRSAGLGLGLSIVQRLCLILDIHLHLISVPGQGSRFVLTMPLLRDDAALPMKREYVQSSPLPPMNVLVIDDEIDIRTGMRLLLEELGCRVVLADGITQAVNAVKSQKFDFVFSDYRLRGDENGIDAIGHVRVVQPNLNAVLISGDTAPERLQSAKNAGISMLHKPVSFEAIVKQLHLTASRH